MSRITFDWDSQKAIEAACYLVGKLGSVDRVVLTKLLYYSDRDHFLAHGAPITGDVQKAMKLGPVPSKTYAMLSGERRECEECVKFLHEDDWSFTVRKDAGTSHLSVSERAILDSVIQAHGSKGKWDLVNEADKLPEYLATYQEGKSEPITYETILKYHEAGDGSRFRKNRPVISRETMMAMRCPFPAW